MTFRESYTIEKHALLVFISAFLSPYDELLGKQIFFTTFHQSLDYEDFVEGLKPHVPVSYTHLDVYKRQQFLRPISNRCICGNFTEHIAHKLI